MEPIPLFTDTGCRTGHYAADKQATLRFVFQSDQDYSGRGAPWRRCCCGGGEPWEPLGGGPRAAHAGLGHEARSPPGRLLASEPRGPATLSKPGGGFPRVPTGEAGPEAVDAFGTLGGARCGARHVRVRRQGGGPRKVSPFPTPDRRRHVPENRDRGIALPLPSRRLLAQVDPGGPAARSRPGGTGSY